MSTMVEKVARALYPNAIERGGTFESHAKGKAIDALNALMDPTGYVEEAGWQSIQSFNSDSHLSLDEVGQVFTAMIQAALKEEAQ